MIPWMQLASAAIPGSRGELRLSRRGAEFSIRLGHNELMNSRLSGSEAALANLTCERLSARKGLRMLIGGLGMGFTLRAALAALGPDARITVAELVPAVVAWARGPMADLSAGCLDDARVAVVERDVAKLIGAAKGAYDAILLDVDNGPEAMVHADNDGLYSLKGLALARAALTPGGILAVWSQGPDAAFARRLADAGFTVEETRVRANAGRGGARHVIWVAVK